MDKEIKIASGLCGWKYLCFMNVPYVKMKCSFETSNSFINSHLVYCGHFHSLNYNRK